MSAIGRIFIVLNLILAAAFVGWAANALGTVEDYKDQNATLQSEHAAALQAKDDEIRQLNSQIGALGDDQRTFREERDDAQARVTELEGLLADAQRTNQNMQERLAAIDATLGDYNSTISQLTQQKDALTQRAQDAERARDDARQASQQAELQRRDAAEALAAAERKIQALAAETSALSSQVASLDTKLSTAAQTYGFNIDAVAAVPQIDAAVLEARFDLQPGLVMLNAGRNKDVKPGYTFHIYRGSQYKGEVRVQNVDENYSSAIVTGLKDGRTIQQGDRASTIL